MEIEVGEYVRIKEKGIIGKIEQIGVSLFWLEDGSAFSIKEESYKHSKIISEIVEVGDYVFGTWANLTKFQGDFPQTNGTLQKQIT